jgi:cytochrome c
MLRGRRSLAQGAIVVAVLSLLLISIAEGDALTGNAAPLVTIHLAGNQMFFWPDVPIEYQVVVSDVEDGDTLAGTIDPHRVAVGFDHFDTPPPSFIAPHVDGDLLGRLGPGKELIAKSNCLVCHTVDGERKIPTYKAIAERFKGMDATADYLATKIISGGSGSWISDGTALMPPHAEFSKEQARQIALYILALGNPVARKDWLPIRATVTPPPAAAPPVELPQERYILWASYTDRGLKGKDRKTAYAAVTFRPPKLMLSDRTSANGVEELSSPDFDGPALVGVQPRALVQFKGVDLTDVREAAFEMSDFASVLAGGRIELRVDDPLNSPIAQTVFQPKSTHPTTVDVAMLIPAISGRHDLFVYLRGFKGDKKGSIALKSIALRR